MRETGGRRLAVRIVEVEAYRAAEDPGSHAYRGPDRAERDDVRPARARCTCTSRYGMHWCMNVVCGGPDGQRGAPARRRAGRGLDVMRTRRLAARRDRDLARARPAHPGARDRRHLRRRRPRPRAGAPPRRRHPAAARPARSSGRPRDRRATHPGGATSCPAIPTSAGGRRAGSSGRTHERREPTPDHPPPLTSPLALPEPRRRSPSPPPRPIACVVGRALHPPLATPSPLRP